MDGIGSHFALHLPFSAAKSAAKVKCQYILVSNNLSATAQEIADTYKARW